LTSNHEGSTIWQSDESRNRFQIKKSMDTDFNQKNQKRNNSQLTKKQKFRTNYDRAEWMALQYWRC